MSRRPAAFAADDARCAPSRPLVAVKRGWRPRTERPHGRDKRRVRRR